MEIVKIKTSLLDANTGQVWGLPSNPRQWTKDELRRLAASLLETPELFEARPCLVYPHEGKYIVLGGNFRLAASKENKAREVPCIVFPVDTPVDKLKQIVIKDNGAFGSWDFDALANEWDDQPLTDWGVPVWDGEAAAGDGGNMTQDEIARKKREFEQRMAAGEISEEDEEYQAFLEKFALKKTTDDCYTPAKVYDAVADWVAQEYGVSRADFVRPFYPGGDYQKEAHKPTDIVVDNPPFSILAEILNYYKEQGVRFFLFAPTLTLFSSSSSSCALPLAVPITYDNGAVVSTSFLTNLEEPGLRLRSAPSLYAVVRAADEEVRKEMRKELPKYSYDHHIITSTWVGALSRLGIDFRVPVAESEPISALAAQKEAGKAIYGKGYIVSDRVFAEREKAEREKVEREKVERWELSDKERAIIARLNANTNFD